MRLDKSKTLLMLFLCGSMTQSLSAFDKKAAVPATATPTKTAKILVSRLTAPRVEETKPKKNALVAVSNSKLKEAPKPLIVAKVGTRENLAARQKETNAAALRNSASATNKKTSVLKSSLVAAPTKALSKKELLAETKSKHATAREQLAAKIELKSKGSKANAQESKRTRTSMLLASLDDAPRKGKFGRDNRGNEETPATKPVAKVTQRETPRESAPVENTFRPIRPRVKDDVAQDSPSQNASADQRETREPETERIAQAPKMPIASPDRIEVVEQSSPVLSQLLSLPTARPSAPYGAIVTRNGTPPPARKDVTIPQQRVFEIQYELSKRGFYSAEPNGIYDDATVTAMWEFQKNYGLPATGYPTAHALKRLGLTSW